MSSHLSELCKASEIGPIVENLKLACPERANLDPDEETEGNKIPLGFSKELHEQMQSTFGGIWSYQDDDGRTAFHWAVAMRNFSLATTLMRSPYFALVLSEDHDGTTPFATVCMVGASEEFLRELLTTMALQRSWKMAQGGENNTSDHNDNNHSDVPVDVSQDVNSETVDEVNMKNKLAVLNQSDIYGTTPLLHASGRGNLAIVRLLLQLGASIDAQNKRGQSALHRATSRGAQDVVEELVATSKKVHSPADHRRWMNLQDSRGDTALFYASMENNEELGRYLLRHGADRELRNKEGKQFWEV